MHNLPLPLAAFLAGVLSFLSPCVLPLVPGYVSLISGASVEELQSSERRILRTVMLHSLTFVLGFSVVFIALGAVATGLGQIVNEYHSLLSKIAGIVVIIFGLHLTGLLKIKALYADKRLLRSRAGLPPWDRLRSVSPLRSAGPRVSARSWQRFWFWLARRGRFGRAWCCWRSIRWGSPYRSCSRRWASTASWRSMAASAVTYMPLRFAAESCSLPSEYSFS